MPVVTVNSASCHYKIPYSKLAKLFVNKDNVDADKNAADLIDVADLQKTLGTAAGIRNFVNNADLQNKSLKLWDYIMQLKLTSSSMEFNAPSRIDEFLTKGYNNYIGKRNGAYSSSNPIGLNLTGSKKYKLESWNSANPGDDLFVNNEFAQLEYNLHT